MHDEDNEILNIDKMAILTEITELAAQLGWVVAVPPEQTTKGIILGLPDFINEYNTVLPLENQFEIINNEHANVEGKAQVH